jgi:hypothetical protein
VLPPYRRQKRTPRYDLSMHDGLHEDIVFADLVEERPAIDAQGPGGFVMNAADLVKDM